MAAAFALWLADLRPAITFHCTAPPVFLLLQSGKAESFFRRTFVCQASKKRRTLLKSTRAYRTLKRPDRRPPFNHFIH
uniref:Putative secreted protein n=1 Tax=Ixodes ricinus TaxID=34613 RepID=A0A6B0U6G1_IXORI